MYLNDCHEKSTSSHFVIKKHLEGTLLKGMIRVVSNNISLSFENLIVNLLE